MVLFRRKLAGAVIGSTLSYCAWAVDYDAAGPTFPQPVVSLREMRQAWVLDPSTSLDERKLRFEIAKHQVALEAEVARLHADKAASDTETAKLVVDLLKALAWPLVVVLLILQFRPYLAHLLQQFGDRLQTAETLKLGVMGQEVQLSGTAKELMREREQLAGTSPNEARMMEAATAELNTPIADILGLLLLSKREPVPLEALTKHLFQAMSPQGTVQQPPFVIVMMSKQIEKVLSALQSLGYVAASAGAYALTASGREFFTRVQERYGLFMAKFQSLHNVEPKPSGA